MMAGTEVGSLYYDLNIDDKNLKGQLDSADKSVKGFSDRLGGHWDDSVKASQRFALALTAVTVGVVAFGVSAVRSFEESQNVMAQTNAVLASTGNAAGITADQVTKLASALERQTKFADEDVQKVENLLLTFTSIGKDIFPQATSTVLDMATALGEDTQSAAIQLGKALQDPILGVTALRRVGVNFNSAQQDVIANLVNTGRAAEAQQMILKELNKEFGGSAVAAGNTLAGQMAKLGNQFDNVKEAIGGIIAEVAVPLLSSLLNWFNAAGGVEGVMNKLRVALEKVQPFLPAIIGAIVGGLIPAFVALGISIWTALAPIIPFIAAAAAIGYAANWIAQQFGGWNVVLSTVGQALRIVTSVVRDMLMPSILALWSTIQTTIVPVFQQIGNILGPHMKDILIALVVAGIIPLAVAVATIVGALWAFVNVLNVVIQVASSVIGWIIRVNSTLWSFYSTVVGIFSGAGGWLYGAGQALIQGFINGITSMIGGVIGAVRGAVGGAIGSVRSLLGIHSPSTVFKEIGRNVTQGFVEGINSTAGMAIDAMGNLGGNIIAPVINGGGTGTGAVTNNTTGGSTIFNIGQVNNQADEDWVMNRMDRSSQLQKMGLSAQ
jgi:hypothetical protein